MFVRGKFTDGIGAGLELDPMPEVEVEMLTGTLAVYAGFPAATDAYEDRRGDAVAGVE